MANLLKFDLYKLVKSKSTWIVFVSIMLVHVLYLVYYYDGGVRGSIAALTPSSGYLNAIDLLLPLFILLFVGKDFSSGYIKNIGSSVKKIYYILSKAVIIALSVFAMYIGMFLLEVVFNYSWGPGQFYTYDEVYSVGWYLAVWGGAMLNHIVGGFWIMLFYLLVRSRLAVGIVDILYYTGLQTILLDFLRSFLKLFQINEMESRIFMDHYFLYSMRCFFSTIHSTVEDLSVAVIRNVLVLAIYAIVFLAGSCFVFSKRKF